mgnify:CR=1 FL=1|tara:strand:- start:2812 stop:2976 length:165 start_codon:yes stop_codon:yes gene_type:complete
MSKKLTLKILKEEIDQVKKILQTKLSISEYEFRRNLERKIEGMEKKMDTLPKPP